MQGGTFQRRPYRRIQWLFALKLAWVALLITMVFWWSHNLISQAKVIASLKEMQFGPSPKIENQLATTQNMVVWESIAFLIFFLIIAALTGYLFLREYRRARSVEAFLASLTHELRTPLTSLRLQAETLSKTDPHAVRLIEDTQRLEDQVEQALSLARLEGGATLHLSAIGLRTWIRRHSNAWVDRFGENLKLENKVADDAEILADAQALETIFRNLIENSVKHGGKSPIEVTLSSSASRAWTTLSVRDNGRADPKTPSRLGKIFEKRAGSNGAGVGLFLVRSLTENMGGRVSFLSSGCEGFETKITLPRPKSPQGESPHE